MPEDGCHVSTHDRQTATTAAYRNESMQEVEGLVNGGVSVDVALGDELVMDHSLQALSQVASLLLKGVLLPLNGSRLPFQLDPVLLQVLVCPAPKSMHQLHFPVIYLYYYYYLHRC